MCGMSTSSPARTTWPQPNMSFAWGLQTCIWRILPRLHIEGGAAPCEHSSHNMYLDLPWRHSTACWQVRLMVPRIDRSIRPQLHHFLQESDHWLAGTCRQL